MGQGTNVLYPVLFNRYWTYLSNDINFSNNIPPSIIVQTHFRSPWTAFTLIGVIESHLSFLISPLVYYPYTTCIPTSSQPPTIMIAIDVSYPGLLESSSGRKVLADLRLSKAEVARGQPGGWKTPDSRGAERRHVPAVPCASSTRVALCVRYRARWVQRGCCHGDRRPASAVGATSQRPGSYLLIHPERWDTPTNPLVSVSTRLDSSPVELRLAPGTPLGFVSWPRALTPSSVAYLFPDVSSPIRNSAQSWTELRIEFTLGGGSLSCPGIFAREFALHLRGFIALPLDSYRSVVNTVALYGLRYRLYH